MGNPESPEGGISEIKKEIEALKIRVTELEEKPPGGPIALFEQLIKLLLENIGKKLNIIKAKP